MLAIDIGSKKVAIAEGSYRNGQVTVSSFSEIEYKDEVVEGGIVTDRPALSFLINEIIKTNRMKSKSAIVTINSGNIIARELQLPHVKLPNLKLLVANELARIIGENNDYITDFVVTGTTGEKMLTVTAYGVPRETVESYYTLLRELKLTPFALDVQANSMAKLLSNTSINGESYEQDNILVADIGYSQLSFHGFSSGKCRFNRTEVSLVQEFVREIGSILRVDVTREHLSELDFSAEPDSENSIVSDTCRYFSYRLSEEIQRYIQYMILNSEIKSVARIFICGGAASIKGLDAALETALKIPVEPLTEAGRLSLPQPHSLTKVCNAAGALIRL